MTSNCLPTATTIDAEPRGDVLLPWANTIYSVRTNTTTVKVFTYLSPTGVTGPRILRFNVRWDF